MVASSERDAQQSLDDRQALALLGLVLSLGVVIGHRADAHFFLRDDFMNYYLGAFAEIVRALKAFELPLVTLTSWHGGALGGEYQYGIFSPVLVASNLLLFSLDLTLQQVAAGLVWIHALILSSGAYFLARSRKLTPELSLMVGLVCSLNGWMVFWGVNWFGALAAFAWVPWVWWAIEKALDGRGQRRYVVATGLFIALDVTAGFPYACLMAAVVVVAAAGRLLLAKRPFRETLPALWSLLIGLGLSAPSWLMLIEYSGATLRSQTTHPLIFQTDLTVPFKAWFGTILPTLNAPWAAPWLPPGESGSIVMHTGLAPTVLLVTAAFVLRAQLVRRLEYEFFILAILLVLVTFPGLGVLRWSFRWLPLFFLQASLVAGGAAMLLRTERPNRAKFGRAAGVLVAAVSAYAFLIDGERRAGPLWLAGGLLTVACLWWAAESIPKLRRLHDHLPWIVVATTTCLAFGIDLQTFPDYQRRVEPRPSPAFDPSVTYLALYTMDDAHVNPLTFSGQRFFPGNEQMHSGLRFVNGYSPLGPAGISWNFAFNYLGAVSPSPLPAARADRPLGSMLRRMAVDGLVVWPDSREFRNIPFEEFEVHASLPQADVYHRRTGPSPRAQIIRRALAIDWEQKVHLLPRSTHPRLEIPGQSLPESRLMDFGEATITAFEEGRNHVRVEVDARGTDLPVVISFARPWFPGYRATVDDQAVELRRLDRMLPAVEVPGGRESSVVLVYRPGSLILGSVFAALTLAGILVGLVLSSRRNRSSA